jgi:DNA-binding transcriptional regulator YhcF (GntR family)
MAMKRQSARMLTEAMVGAGLSKWEAEALVSSVEEVYFSDPELAPVRDGQMRYSCVRGDEGPGKPLSACRKVSATLTLLHPEDKQGLRGFADEGGMSTEVRQRRIVRIVEEAREQGGLLTQEDLSEILTCHPRTIRRDIQDLKQRGFVLPTRGQQQDIGPGVSHRSLAVEKWLEGKEPVEIARLIRHSVASVEGYLEKFKRVAWLSREKHFNAFEIALTVGMSVVSVRTYLGLCAQYRDTPQLAQRTQDIQAIGQAFYHAQDEKKHSNCATGSSATWRSK